MKLTGDRLINDVLFLLVVVDTKVSVVLGDLVSVLARSWDLDGSCPVVVVEAKSEGQVLHIFLSQVRVVKGNVEMSWEDTTLSS